MSGKLKSQTNHTLTGMATKLPNANDIVLDDDLAEGDYRALSDAEVASI